MIARVASTALRIRQSIRDQRRQVMGEGENVLIQRDGNQVAEIRPAVHRELLSTPLKELFERNDRHERH